MLAERGFDPRTSGLWAQHASTAPLCFDAKLHNEHLVLLPRVAWLSSETNQ